MVVACVRSSMNTLADRARVVGIVAALLLMAACGAPGSGAGAEPDSPVTGGGAGRGPKGRAQIVAPDPGGVVNPRAVSWTKAKVEDDTHVVVTYYGGVEECYGLDRVKVGYRSERISITLFEGIRPGAGACIELAMAKATRVELSEPVAGRKLVDGAKLR